ncbi:MAG: hypothetical protein HQL66_00830 [Magnetococcales bacterium]|nr:hypothetical protein [Magnetococcales bacterium]
MVARYLSAILVLGTLFVGGCLVSWRKWADITVDYGRSLYIPWRMNEGDVLYRDLDAIFGPLSHAFHTWLFRVFETSFMTLVVTNLIGIILLAACIFHFFRRHILPFSDHATGLFVGTLVASVFLAVFAFGQYIWAGNYNYVVSYSPEAVHGTILLAFMVTLAASTLGNPGRIRFLVWLMGGVCGLIFMTRVDMTLAALMIVAVYMLLAWRAPAHRVLGLSPRVALFAGGVVTAILVVYVMIGQFPLAYIWHDINVLLVRGRIDKNPFYATVMGTDNWQGNLWVMTKNMFVYLALIVGTAMVYRAPPAAMGVGGKLVYVVAGLFPMLMVTLWIWEMFPISGLALICLLPIVGLVWSTYRSPPVVGRVEGWLRKAASLVPMLVAALWILLTPPTPFLKLLLLSIPLLVLMMAGMFLVALLRPREKQGFDGEGAVPWLLWATFSFALLLKVPFNARIFHYGFIHVMPATLLLVAFLVGHLPAWLRALGLNDRHFRLVMTVLIVLTSARLVSLGYSLYAKKDFPVGEGQDQMFVYSPKNDARGEVIGNFLAWMKERAAPNATFVVVPEGVMLNYLARRKTVTPSMSFLPLELLRIPEEQQIAYFEQRPPDYFVVIKRTLKEYSLPGFGESPKLGQKMMSWIHGHYSQLAFLEPKNEDPGKFWIRILGRKESPYNTKQGETGIRGTQ